MGVLQAHIWALGYRVLVVPMHACSTVIVSSRTRLTTRTIAVAKLKEVLALYCVFSHCTPVAVPDGACMNA